MLPLLWDVILIILSPIRWLIREAVSEVNRHTKEGPPPDDETSGYGGGWG